MPTILRATTDGSPVVRFHHFSVTSTYLDIAYRHAAPLSPKAVSADNLSRAIIAITFSAMSLEAFANEVAEGLFNGSELKAFVSLKGRFRQKGVSGIGQKIAALLVEKNYQPMPLALTSAIEELVSLRNSLVHYKLSDTAAKSYHPPMRGVPAEDGHTLWCLDFNQPPTQVEPPFLARVNQKSAIEAYNTAYDFACLWCAYQNHQEGTEGFERITEMSAKGA